MENDRKSRAERLMDKGYAAIKDDDSCKAIAIGKRLRTLRHSSGFEILALAYAAQGKLGLAIRTLERGVSKAPSVWLLWNLLGNYFSDMRCYSDALRAYQHALKCPRNDASFFDRLLPVRARKSAVIEECRLVERRPNGSKGLYAASGSILFPTKRRGRRK